MNRPTRRLPGLCPNRRRQKVRRGTAPYQCERLRDGQTVTVIVPYLSLPRCRSCGVLVFDSEAQE
jgi:hypothetical protein